MDNEVGGNSVNNAAAEEKQWTNVDNNATVNENNVNKSVAKDANDKKKMLIIGGIALLVLLLAVVTILAISRTNNKADTKNPAVAEMNKRLPELKSAVDKNPKDPNARYSLASAYYATGDKGAAVSEYEKAAELDGKNAALQNSLGNAYRDEKRFDDAVKAYTKAIELQPTNKNAYINLADVQMNSKNDAKAAVATYTKAVGAFNGATDVMLLKGMAQEKAGDKSGAKATYEEILGKEPENAAAKASAERLK